MAENIPCIVCVSKAREPNATPEAVNAAAELHTREAISCHYLTVHPQHNHMCDICGCGFSSRTVLSLHLRSAHNEPGLDLPVKKKNKKKRSRYYKWWKCGTGGFD
ncbi:hypothetical protein LWI29_036008 [Acer saccharum]|uniref:C2H2-type domain-containing protein n=1 Tax=Acer saccharum TaxID=4024 RepID=A0AA39RNA5_ACESA|nr:hypothetical protein LWI29_025669 [Acer saccharum]KAK0575252.1 hypothetical protein LWI29_036008 [Acer saccharum]